MLKNEFLLLQKTKAPELLPEDTDHIWSQSSKKFISSGQNVKNWSSGLVSKLSDHLGDPRIGPSLLLGALMSFGLIWLSRSRATQSGNQNKSYEPKVQISVVYRSLPACPWHLCVHDPWIMMLWFFEFTALVEILRRTFERYNVPSLRFSREYLDQD